ncbi:MAG: ferritin-like domain-containing protein [Mesorhizobium sp.]|uniref:ferritin-like domain-containing protein n=1 Tax=unclassified Mesorhizobium TaxID=325217 RepID=UPI000FD576EA|nr:MULTISPECIES: ferritin-like domain-containing protein [unclassified Mesorhizobium]RUV95812.1 ferritin-like domain-containing protein [Mesorhizobium sp. M5C.F.Ca.IN.020.14.1.1]RUV17656.1 ferritin-like domain-containing protein [Mesorhizobium sp. M5C.F.Ca.IN.020.32.2.1]RWD50879.1 MAG: ferritin-like domain-containing protein [Mesorhizobium sp.]RWE07517.1 MAG: ferritin-like domain-containing protein [Mesorhizobium sp.]RWE58558.1 MAG: ferritin-like domain-containing protein [Mesorhizobium sp.]
MFRAIPSLILPRRRLLQFGLGATLASTVGRASVSLADEASEVQDEDIFQFALNLEYMEAEYYLRGTTGKGIDDSDAGADAGQVTGGKQVSFETPAIGEFMAEVAENELAHVRFYRKTLGDQAVPRPTIDFEAGFAAVAKAAALGEDFDPFGNETNFVLGGMLFEDVGVTAYAGAATVLKNKDFLAAAAGILAVEAYHMGMARSTLYRKGEQAWKAANAVSDARDKIDGSDDKDQGIQIDGKANIVPSTPDAIAFTRTPQEVLRIVYLTDQEGASKGGFYPNGMNGKIKST